MADDRYLFS